MRGMLSVPFLVALGACGGGAAEEDTASERPGFEVPSVMRDCPAEPGTICPWAGNGTNGYNGDDVHRLDAWLSYPMSVAISAYGPPVVADWNNHKLRILEEDPEDGFLTVMGTSFLGDGDPDLLDLT